MGGKHARDKGARFEREVANMLAPLDPSAKRNVAECQEASVDIITKLPIAIQCKNLARWSSTPHAILEQATTGALNSSDMPVGIVRISNKKPDLAIVSLPYFLCMLEKLYGKNQDNGSV